MEDDRAQSFLQLIHKQKQGRLKIYLGYGPGVGKTYAMLSEAKRLQTEGLDIVIGLVETHGRAGTEAQLRGFELIPRRSVEYRGIQIEEMDLDAIIARKPEIVVVDELAHTNAPGSRNAKRYEDVQELLKLGIHVISTLNVQHLESLYNTVEQLLGVRVRERIPDSVVLDADEIVNVDLTPKDLQNRLSDGKIYPRDRIESSLKNFFQEKNLEHLRELTLREIASQIDFRQRGRGRSAASEQIMVCLASKGPDSARLLRAASRLAGKFNRNWYAVYVQTPEEAPRRVDAETQRALADTLTLANQLGATVYTLKGTDVVQTIMRFAEEHRVGQIMIGAPNEIPFWKRILGKRTMAEKILLASRTTTLVIVPSPQGGS